MKVRCVLPNAGFFISGVNFSQDGAHKVSEDISEDVARKFLSIPGYLTHVEDNNLDDNDELHVGRQPDSGDGGNNYVDSVVVRRGRRAKAL